MKKNRNVLVIALCLALISAFLVFQNKKGTIKEELKDFAVNDTAAITKIFLANKKNNSVLLERKEKFSWMVNGKYQVEPGIMKVLLSTIKSLSVKTRVAKAGYNGVIKDLATEGIKCEIYQHDEKTPMKVYYVGGSTADVLGTFMLLENSSLPFVMELPGFQGYLTPRYSPFEQDWRDRVIFSYKPEEIKNITINYFQQPEKSFSIEHSANRFNISSLVLKQTIQHIDSVGLINYLSFFNYLCFESLDKEYTHEQVDSLKTTTPINTITITDVNGISKSITTYPKPLTMRSLAQSDSLGNPLKYDLDRLYAFTDGGKEFVVIQYYVFGKIFRQFSDFDMDRRNTKMKIKK